MKDFVVEKIAKCDVITDFDERLSCKSVLLREVTEVQDFVNLDIMGDFRRTDPACSKDPRWTPVHIVDNANAVILGISRAEFDPKTFWREGSYVYEKYPKLCSKLRMNLSKLRFDSK